MNRYITLQTPHGSLHGQLERPDYPRGLILLARSHHVAVDTTIAANFAAYGYATFAMELLTAQEVQFVDATQNVPRLALRLIDILDMIRNDGDMQELPLAIFATGDIAPAAIRAAAQRDTQVKALACHGGLIDRAGAQALDLLIAPLLMLFDTDDDLGKTAYQRASAHLGGVHERQVMEIGDDPTSPVAAWFSRYLGR
jgi:hypothetical protein